MDDFLQSQDSGRMLFRGYYKTRIKTNFPSLEEFDFCVAVIPGENGDIVDIMACGEEDPDEYFCGDTQLKIAPVSSRLHTPLKRLMPFRKIKRPPTSVEDDIIGNFEALTNRPKLDLRACSCQNWEKISAEACKIAADRVYELYSAYCAMVKRHSMLAHAPYALDLEEKLLSFATWVSFIDFEQGVQHIPDNDEMDGLLSKTRHGEIWGESGPWTNWPDQC